jgi:hypothetical protein
MGCATMRQTTRLLHFRDKLWLVVVVWHRSGRCFWRRNAVSAAKLLLLMRRTAKRMRETTRQSLSIAFDPFWRQIMARRRCLASIRPLLLAQKCRLRRQIAAIDATYCTTMRETTRQSVSIAFDPFWRQIMARRRCLASIRPLLLAQKCRLRRQIAAIDATYCTTMRETTRQSLSMAPILC